MGCQATEHEADHGEADEGGGFAGVTLEVFGEATAAADPGKGALDDPAFGENDEAMQFVALDDFNGPGSGRGDCACQLRSLIASVGEDPLDERKRRRVRRSRTSGAPSRSCKSAEWTTTFSKRPSVSTRMCRLRPLTFLPAS